MVVTRRSPSLNLSEADSEPLDWWPCRLDEAGFATFRPRGIMEMFNFPEGQMAVTSTVLEMNGRKGHHMAKLRSMAIHTNGMCNCHQQASIPGENMQKLNRENRI
jgi:hypothetical protein